MNSVICTLCFYDTILVRFILFFSLSILNLVMKILGIVNTHLMNTHTIFRNFIDTSLNFEEWYRHDSL
jgi:hypothetical protein